MMNAQGISWMKCLGFMTLVALSAANPAEGFALNKQAVYVVGKDWAEDEVCAEQREQSKEFILYLLRVIRDDLKGEAVNRGLEKQSDRSNEPDGVLDLQLWLSDQIEDIRVDENALAEARCERADRGDDDDRYRTFLTEVWRSRSLDQRPALVLLDYEGRRTYFYSESSGVKPRHLWKAMSPDCADGLCSKDVRREQRPMDRASRVLLLQYLAAECLLDETDRSLAMFLIGAALGDVKETHLPNKDDIPTVSPFADCGEKQ